jgi:hypothetical protein
MKEKISLDEETINSNNVVLVPRQKTADDVVIIKGLRQQGAKVYYPNQGLYTEARGGLWEISLMLIQDIAIGILVTILIDWAKSKAKEYKESKHDVHSEIKSPIFRIRMYLIKEQKYIEISGDEEYIAKILKSLEYD